MQQLDADAKKPVPACLYQMFDNEGTNFQSLVPERGPVGSVQWAIWETVNPGQGQYNWAAMDARLAAVKDMTITLDDGSVVPHPVILQVFPYLSGASNWPYEFYDCTPQWIYRKIGDRPTVGGKLVGHKLTGCGYTATMPAYDSYAWRESFYDLIRAMGEHYDDNPQVVGVVIATGIDGEHILSRIIIVSGKRSLTLKRQGQPTDSGNSGKGVWMCTPSRFRIHNFGSTT